MTVYEAVIGLEVHIQLNTLTKVFCGCAADSWGAPPNSNICPVCVGHPGVLPVLNRSAVEKAVLLGAALSADVSAESFFDRKNYFYPDLPKGYQITQFDRAICHGGVFSIAAEGEAPIKVRLSKMHLEEDAGKTRHVAARGARLIDMNRCGVPLVEMVTEADLRSADQAAAFLTQLRQLLRWLDVSEANMERGHLRCDANVSIREAGSRVLNTKTEIKNVNSIEAVRNAIEAEIKRQIETVESGGRVAAWTLDWDDEAQTLRKMRSKETEADYRYFREPDLLSLQLDDTWRATILERLPELPVHRRARFIDQYGLSVYDASLLTDDRALSDYFEATVRAGAGKIAPKTVANWFMNDILRTLNDGAATIQAVSRTLTPTRLAELVELVEAKTINRATAVGVLGRVLENDRSPAEIVASEGLAQISGDDAIRELCRQVLAENPAQVAQYKSKPTLLQFFVGQVMKKSRGKANAQVAERIIQELLQGSA
jgi:aspartyl-tRNA(Asn)/glutamyl-tRNA(Gln) amidotransferase subunit B